MYTANTMACAIEALGMSLPYSSSSPADSAVKVQECADVGTAMHRLLVLGLRPRDIMTRAAFGALSSTVWRWSHGCTFLLYLFRERHCHRHGSGRIHQCCVALACNRPHCGSAA